MESSQVAVMLQFHDGIEILQEPFPAQLTGAADNAAFPDMGKAVLDRRRADQFQNFVESLFRFQHAVAVFDVVGEAGFFQSLTLFGFPRAPINPDIRELGFDQLGKGNPYSARCTPNQNLIGCLDPQILHGTESRIVGFRNGRQLGPGQIGVDGVDLVIRQQDIFRITPVEGPPHLSHDRHHFLTERQFLFVARTLHYPYAFNP